MGSLGFIIVLALVATAGTNNVVVEARNINLRETKVVQQDPLQHYHMLPRGPVPPSGPSSDPPGYPPETSSDLYVSAASYHTMPKGVPYPPSGPSHGSTPDPPGPPPTRY